MSTEGLEIGRGLRLPLDAITQTLAILARRGAGKTYTAKVLAEEMIEHDLPVVVLDPIGVWWGLRSSASGSAAGYQVTILGGDHGDLPLEPAAGTLVANLVADEPVAVVLDLSGFETKAAQARFVTDFAERLYRAKTSNKAPLHLILDEADEFAPQRPMPGEQRMLGAFETLVRRGRARGIGCTMITQRPAALNKNVLTQIECLVVMQMTGPQDRAAIKEWVRGHADVDELRTVDESLASLQQGEAWWWSPAWLSVLQRVQTRQAHTFDSSATPKPGEVRREAKVLASVDLDRLKDGMERVVKEVEANDPKRLRARIRELERELARKPAAQVETVEVPVVPDELREQMDALGVWLQSMPHVALDALAPVRPKVARSTPQPRQPARVVTDERLGKAERAILSILAQHPRGRSHSQLALLSGYRSTASTIGVALSKLRALGYVTPNGTPTITDAGSAVAQVEPLPSGPDLLAYWLNHRSLGKAERLILQEMVNDYPASIGHAELCRRCGYSESASTVGVAMSKLRKVGLVEGWTAAADFMEAIA